MVLYVDTEHASNTNFEHISLSQENEVWFKEFNHTPTTMIVLLFFKTLFLYKSLTPSKSMPQKSNHDSKEKCPYIHTDTIEPMRIKDILTINSCFFCCTPRFSNTSKTQFGQEVTTIIVVDVRLHFLIHIKI